VCAISETELIGNLTDKVAANISADLGSELGAELANQPPNLSKTSMAAEHTVLLPSLALAPPDLLIVDYQLDHGCSGVDLACRLQSELSTKFPRQQVPVLVISADLSAELRSKLQLLDFHFLPKPVSPVKLKALLNRVL
jgi:CheY-like chemotaxis protein